MKRKILLLILTFNFLLGNSKGVINEFYFDLSKLLKKPYEITIIDGNKKIIKTKTRANFVWEVIKEKNIKINKKDRIIPSARTPITPNLKIIKIDRITEKIVKNYVVEIPDTIFKISYGNNYKERLIQRGNTGKFEEEWYLIYVNGKLEKKILRNRKVLIKKESRIYEITSPVLKNLKLTSATFRTKRVLRMTATAYYPWEGKGINDITALGWRAERGVVAVDPRIIPLRTALYIPNYGFSIAGDTGGAIKGYRIDLLLPTRQETLNFGRRKIAVFILERIN
jgi:3D (Asp-Asp-Asp) domain-containing protein